MLSWTLNTNLSEIVQDIILYLDIAAFFSEAEIMMSAANKMVYQFPLQTGLLLLMCASNVRYLSYAYTFNYA